MKIKLILFLISIFLLVLFLRYWINAPERSFIITPICKLETNAKTLALTFDDGPNPEVTPQLLEILKQQKVKATFFVNGNKLQKYPAIAKQIVGDGHQLGNHSFEHDAMVFKSYDFIEQDMLKTDSLIRLAGQKEVKLYRPPYGKSFINLPRVLRDHQREMINWSIAPIAQYDVPFNPNGIVNQVVENVVPGGIILLHDGMDHVDAEGLVKTVEEIISKSRTQGYSFVQIPIN